MADRDAGARGRRTRTIQGTTMDLSSLVSGGGAGGADDGAGLVKDTTTRDFMKDVIEESRAQPVLVDFWAPWCGPCRQIAPVIEQLAAENAGTIKVGKLNVDNSPTAAQNYGVSSIPTLIVFKNGVAVGYFEGLSLFERMESGFNLYYTFRDGETAWLYAWVLNVMRHLLGVTTFAIDPYQIGFENEEGIESGAFWFYRKLGFRPVLLEVLEFVEKEEQKIANRSGYRTSARTLRRLAESSMIFELNKAHAGDWDRFQVRKIGFKAAREKAKHFTELLNLQSWSADEKNLLDRIVRAKTSAEETTYLKLMRRHERLRREIIRLGS